MAAHHVLFTSACRPHLQAHGSHTQASLSLQIMLIRAGCLEAHAWHCAIFNFHRSEEDITASLTIKERLTHLLRVLSLGMYTLHMPDCVAE